MRKQKRVFIDLKSHVQNIQLTYLQTMKQIHPPPQKKNNNNNKNTPRKSSNFQPFQPFTQPRPPDLRFPVKRPTAAACPDRVHAFSTDLGMDPGGDSQWGAKTVVHLLKLLMVGWLVGRSKLVHFPRFFWLVEIFDGWFSWEWQMVW